jgi:hypothetical protein
LTIFKQLDSRLAAGQGAFKDFGYNQQERNTGTDHDRDLRREEELGKAAVKESDASL